MNDAPPFATDYRSKFVDARKRRKERLVVYVSPNTLNARPAYSNAAALDLAANGSHVQLARLVKSNCPAQIDGLSLILGDAEDPFTPRFKRARRDPRDEVADCKAQRDARYLAIVAESEAVGITGGDREGTRLERSQREQDLSGALTRSSG